jgi:hypothetical protein
MMPLTYLAALCSQIDRNYSVSLSYGASVGDAPHWTLAVAIPSKDIRLARKMKNLAGILKDARELGVELEHLLSLYMVVKRGEITVSLDNYEAGHGNGKEGADSALS